MCCSNADENHEPRHLIGTCGLVADRRRLTQAANRLAAGWLSAHWLFLNVSSVVVSQLLVFAPGRAHSHDEGSFGATAYEGEPSVRLCPVCVISSPLLPDTHLHLCLQS